MYYTGMRKFGGKWYTLKDEAKTKTEATKLAKRYRESGLHLVRVVPLSRGYGIYLKTIGSREPRGRELAQLKRMRG